MSYKDKPQIKLYKSTNSHFELQAIIDDYAEVSFEHNLYEAGQFTITINYNIPNALLFERGLWVQFGTNPYNFGEILNITDSIGEDGKGSQIREITGYDARYIFKRRIIKSLNSENTWTMTAKGELCIRNLIADQCGSNAESKRQLPVINTIPAEENTIGKVYSVSESFTNLYEVLTTIATQSEIGWRINFDGYNLTLECYEGTDRSATVRFDTNFESLSNGTFTDSAESFANTVYVGGKGQNDDRDIYEGETEIGGASPSGLDRYECWDNQSSMTTEEEYEAEALSILSQYGQTLQVSGSGLAKCPYIYGEEYDIGDIITIAFSGKSAVVQILSVIEHWAWGAYELEFSFGKPQPDLSKQMQLMLKQIQKASNKENSTDSVKWYTIPTDTTMSSSDVTYRTIGFVGECASGGSTFTLYLDDEKTGAKSYHVWFKQLGGGNLTLTTGRSGASNLVLNSGTYVAIIQIDEDGNVTMAGATATTSVISGNNQPVTSNAVAGALSGKVNTSDVVDRIEVNNSNPVTSNAVSQAITNTKNGTVMENLDLNSYTECGLYVTKNDESYTNIPEGMNDRYFSLLVVATAKYLPPQTDFPFRNQILYKYDSSEIYIRTYSWREQGLTWGEWRKVVFQDELGIKETEKRIGTWIDGSPLFEKAILFDVPQNGEYAIPINVTNLKNVVNWRGNFFQNGYQNPVWIMHIPYTYFDPNNLADMINIYAYYNPPALGFQCAFYGSGTYASGYFVGQGILYIQYTKNS